MLRITMLNFSLFLISLFSYIFLFFFFTFFAMEMIQNTERVWKRYNEYRFSIKELPR